MVTVVQAVTVVQVATVAGADILVAAPADIPVQQAPLVQAVIPVSVEQAVIQDLVDLVDSVDAVVRQAQAAQVAFRVQAQVDFRVVLVEVASAASVAWLGLEYQVSVASPDTQAIAANQALVCPALVVIADGAVQRAHPRELDPSTY